MAFKVVVSDPKSKKAYQKEVEEKASGLIGKKIGDKISGSFLGLEGYELAVTGGSDNEGFPMRPDVDGQGRKKIILAFPPGFHPEQHGQRKRKSIRGNQISQDISQVNMKVVKAGTKSLDTLLGAKEKKEKPKEGEEKKEGKKEEKAEEKPKGEGKAEEKEAKPEKEEKPAEAPKEEKAEKAEKKMGVKTLEEIESPVKETRDVSMSTEGGHTSSPKGKHASSEETKKEKEDAKEGKKPEKKEEK